MSSVIPDGWFLKSLDEISIFIKDGTHGTHERLNEGIPLLSAKNISSDGHINCDSGDSLISEIDYQKIHAKYAIEKDDLLLTVVGTLGRTALVPEGFLKFTLQRSVAVIRLDAKTIHPELCYQYLRGDDFQRQLSLRSNSTAQAGVYLGELARISVPIPPLPEQKKIASILTSVDEVIENTQKQIDKLQDLKKATMNELLTKGIGHTEFKDSGLGRIPEGWHYSEIQTLVKDYKGSIVDGPFGSNLKTSDYVETGVPVLQGKNVTNDRFMWSDVRYITKDKAKELSRSSVRVGDILMVKIGSVGYSAIVDNLNNFGFAIIPANLLKIDIDESKAVTKYVHHYMTSPEGKKRIVDAASSTAQPALSLGTMKKFRLPIPPLPEQKKIASILTSMDKTIEEHQRKLAQTQSLKKSLMQDLLTGKIRVTVN